MTNYISLYPTTFYNWTSMIESKHRLGQEKKQVKKGRILLVKNEERE
jgi:hypothetical protein